MPPLAAAAPIVGRSLARTLAPLSVGRHDPTTVLSDGAFLRATITPHGPGTLLVRWNGDLDAEPRAEAWGPGGEWLVERVPGLTGAYDQVPRLPDVHPVVTAAARRDRHVRLTTSGMLYHELLPTVLAQRITSGEARRQWRRLCVELGEPAPGPFPDLRLPPGPATLARRPAWWFHPLGIETKRARALSQVARVADRLWEWAAAGPATAAVKLRLIPGVGEWTVGATLGHALGDADAVAVGDFHLKHLVAWSLAGEPRGTDERMLQLLEPFEGQRGRVIRLLVTSGLRAPARGPRRRILPMHRW